MCGVALDGRRDRVPLDSRRRRGSFRGASSFPPTRGIRGGLVGLGPAFGLRANGNGRLRACRYANGHLQGADADASVCRVLTVACRVAGLGIFLERLAAGPRDVLVGIFHTGCICLVRGIEGLERILTAN